MKKSAAIPAILIFVLCALLPPSEAAAPKATAKKELSWIYYHFAGAKTTAAKRDKPILVFVGTPYGIRSWEMEIAVLNTERFEKAAERFVLCRVKSSSKALKKACGDKMVRSASLIFFDKNGVEIERIKWEGKPDKMIETVERVADGKGVSQLQAAIQQNPKDTTALKTLYEIYSHKMDAAEAGKTLGQLLKAEPESAEKYAGHRQFWAVLEQISKDRGNASRIIADNLKNIKDPGQRDFLFVQYVGAKAASGKLSESSQKELNRIIKSSPNRHAAEKACEALLRHFTKNPTDAAKAPALAENITETFPYNNAAQSYLRLTAAKLFTAKKYKECTAILKALAKNCKGTGTGATSEFLFRALTCGNKWKQRAAWKREVIDILYVVPDAPTFLEYISRWDKDSFFPVLINSGSSRDRRLITKFCAEFKPSRIVKVKKGVGKKLDENLVRKAVLASFGEKTLSEVAEAGPEAFKKFYAANNLSPLGIVFVDTADPGLLAGGVALAAGHKQLVDFFSSGYKSNQDLPRGKIGGLRNEIHKKISSWGYSFKLPFDDIEFLTVACPLPLRYRHKNHREYSTDDYISRRDDDIRFAYCGRLVDGITSSDYMAMCALFLQPQNVLFFNGYGTRKKFASYSTAGAAAMLEKSVPTRNVDGKNSSLAAWREMMKEVNTYRLVFINSAGGASDWITANGKATTQDIPAESAPAIIHITHSYSAANPYNDKTIAGKWLSAGAYIYYGSVHEPYVTAFRKPTEYITSILENEPLGMAFRRRFGRPFWRAWKLCHIGDPVYVLAFKQPSRKPSKDIRLGKYEEEKKKIGDIFPR